MQVCVKQYESSKQVTYSLEDYETKAQLLDMYKNEVVVEKLIDAKTSRGGQWVRPHPELPDEAEATLYPCWAGAGKRAEEEKGATSSLIGTNQLDMEDATTKGAAQLLMQRAPTLEAVSCLQEAAVATPRKMLTENAEPMTEEKKPLVEKKPKTPLEVARAKITKQANVATLKLRAVQSLQLDIEGMADDTETALADKALYKAKFRSIFNNLTTANDKLNASLALKDRATADHLDKLFLDP